ncbi:MAG: hypothetical protein ACOZJX_09250 [Pseudomonadota bacterium]
MNTPNPLSQMNFKPEFQTALDARPSLPQILGDKDQRDWMLSSLELRDGLQVREILETLPMELWDFF